MLDIFNRSCDVPKKCHESKEVPPRLLYKKIRQIGVSKECAQNVNKLHKMCLQSSKIKSVKNFAKKNVLKSAEFAARESHANPSLWWRPLLCCWPPSLTIFLIVIIVITGCTQIPISTLSHIWVFVRLYGIVFVIIVIIIIIIMIIKSEGVNAQL